MDSYRRGLRRAGFFLFSVTSTDVPPNDVVPEFLGCAGLLAAFLSFAFLFVLLPNLLLRLRIYEYNQNIFSGIGGNKGIIVSSWN